MLFPRAGGGTVAIADLGMVHLSIFRSQFRANVPGSNAIPHFGLRC
jgi:hypothetical protein